MSMLKKTKPILLKYEKLSLFYDFYTFFKIILDYSTLKTSDLNYLYKVLIFISKDISPSNDNCKSLKDYANNCITQSNSKKARQKRHDILVEILFNVNDQPNEIQQELIVYYKLQNKLKKVSNFYTLQIS